MGREPESKCGAPAKCKFGGTEKERRRIVRREDAAQMRALHGTRIYHHAAR